MTETCRRLAICASGLALLAISLPTSSAFAEPISTVTVTSGSVTVLITQSKVDLKGTQNFSLLGTWDTVIGLCFPCQVGETQDFSASLAGSFNTGTTGTFRGKTYAFDLNQGGGRLQFDAPTLTLPSPPPGDTAQFTLPFTLRDSGPLRSIIGFEPGNHAPGFHVAVRGSGTATLFTEIFHDPDFGPLYTGTSLRYDFSTPTPEPASLVLIGTGIGVGWWQRRRRVCGERV